MNYAGHVEVPARPVNVNTVSMAVYVCGTIKKSHARILLNDHLCRTGWSYHYYNMREILQIRLSPPVTGY